MSYANVITNVQDIVDQFVQAKCILVFVYKFVILCLQPRENVFVGESIYNVLFDYRRRIRKQNLQNDSELTRFLVFRQLYKTLTNQFVLVVNASG
jgi:hypothetical protein